MRSVTIRGSRLSSPLAVALLFGFFFLCSSPAFAQQIEQASSPALGFEQSYFRDTIRHNDADNKTVDWQATAFQSLGLLGLEHGFRMVQPKTRDQLKGPFFQDWEKSVKGVHGWGDGDSAFTNYFAHPMQGAVAGFIETQNDSRGRLAEFSRSRTYWTSRLRAMGWAAIYSTQFELGPISEATLGNVGMKPGTAGYTDLVMTPVGGFGMIVLEDAVDKYFVTKLEQGTDGLNKRRLYRMLFNPQRSVANLMRGKVPWYRDSRPISSPRLPAM